MPRKRIAKPKCGWRYSNPQRFAFTTEQRNAIVAALGGKGGEFTNVFVLSLELEMSFFKAAITHGETAPSNKQVHAALSQLAQAVTGVQNMIENLDDMSLERLRHELRLLSPGESTQHDLLTKISTDLSRLGAGVKKAITSVEQNNIRKRPAPRKDAYEFLSTAVAASLENTLGATPAIYDEGAYAKIMVVCLLAAGIPTTSIRPSLKRGAMSVRSSDTEAKRLLSSDEKLDLAKAIKAEAMRENRARAKAKRSLAPIEKRPLREKRK